MTVIGVDDGEEGKKSDEIEMHLRRKEKEGERAKPTSHTLRQ